MDRSRICLQFRSIQNNLDQSIHVHRQKYDSFKLCIGVENLIHRYFGLVLHILSTAAIPIWLHSRSPLILNFTFEKSLLAFMRLKSSALKVSTRNLNWTKKSYKKEERKTNQSQIRVQFCLKTSYNPKWKQRSGSLWPSC